MNGETRERRLSDFIPMPDVPDWPARRAQWERLAEQIAFRKGRFLCAIGDAGGPCSFIDSLTWLEPLARELQRQDSLHALYPMTHHAVIDLRAGPGSVYAEGECLCIQAVAPESFAISISWHAREARRHCREQNCSIKTFTM